MVRDTHNQNNDHVRRINELFADAKRRSSSADPPKYVDIELINKKCNIHRGLTPQSTINSHQHHNNHNNNSRRGSTSSQYNNSGLYFNHNNNHINNNNNNNKKTKTFTSSNTNISTTGVTTSSDDDNNAAESFIKDLQRRQSFSENYHRDMQHKQIHDTLEALTGDKYRKRNVWNADFPRNIEHPSAFPSLLRSSNTTSVPPRQKESIASQVAAEVIEATAAAMRDHSNGDENYYGRRSSINSLKNDSIHGSNNKLKVTKRPSFGSINSNLNNRRDSAVSLRSVTGNGGGGGSKRNSVDRTDYISGFRAGSVPPPSSSTSVRRGSTSYDSTYGSLPRRRSSTTYDTSTNLNQYGSLPRKNGLRENNKRYVSTGNLLTRKTSLEPRDYVNTTKGGSNSSGSSRLYSTPQTSTTTKLFKSNITPLKTHHSILRKSSSPTAFEQFDSDTSGGGDTSRSSLTKENLHRHVRILEDAEHENRRLQQNLLEDAINDDDDNLFREFNNSHRDGKRFSIDSLDIRKNSAIDLIEEDIMANLSMNDNITEQTTTERKMHNGSLICDTNSNRTPDILTSNRDYYNIPKNNKYSGSRKTTTTPLTKSISSSAMNLCSIVDNDNNNNINNNNSINNNSNNKSNSKCNFEIQCESGIRKHNNGINNCNNILLQNDSNYKKGYIIKDHNSNCFECYSQIHHQPQSSSSPSQSSIINKKNKKNFLISRSVDDLRLEDHLFNNYTPAKTELTKYNNNNNSNNNKSQYGCYVNDNYKNNYGGSNRNNHIINNNRNIINHHQQSSPNAQRILPNNNININNNNNSNNKILQHNFPKQKSALYQIKNKHYSMDNLLTAVNQHFIEISNNNNNNNNNNINNNNSRKSYDYQVDTDRPQFVAVTSFEECQAIRCAEFHPNGKLYAIGSNSKTFRICEYPSLVDIREDHTSFQPTVIYEKPKYHKGSIYCMDWSPDGELIATGSNDKTIKLMRYNDSNKQLEGREIELTMHDGTIRDVCFIEDTSNKASLLISGGAGDNKIYVTDCGTATPFQALSGHGGHILSLFNWGGAMFVSGSHDKTIRFWDLRTRSCVNTITPSTQQGLRHGSPVAAVCVDPSGRLLVSGHEDSSCVLYDIRGNRPIQCFKPHTADIRSIRFSPSAYYLLTAGYDKKLMLTDLQGDLTLQLPSVVVANHSDKVISGRWHPTDFSFLSTSADKTCVLWALTSKP